MNQGRIWTVVKPTVGLPLLLGSVAVTAVLVHYAILSHTTWFSAYWNGNTKAKTSMSDDATRVASITSTGPAYVINR
jgi:light-harvesting protein B-800-850 alpha chain